MKCGASPGCKSCLLHVCTSAWCILGPSQPSHIWLTPACKPRATIRQGVLILPALLPVWAPSLFLVGDTAESPGPPARLCQLCQLPCREAGLSSRAVWFCSRPLRKAVLVFCLIETTGKWSLGSNTGPGLGHDPSSTPWAADTGSVEAALEKSHCTSECSIWGA